MIVIFSRKQYTGKKQIIGILKVCYPPSIMTGRQEDVPPCYGGGKLSIVQVIVHFIVSMITWITPFLSHYLILIMCQDREFMIKFGVNKYCSAICYSKTFIYVFIGPTVIMHAYIHYTHTLNISIFPHFISYNYIHIWKNWTNGAIKKLLCHWIVWKQTYVDWHLSF